MAKYYTKMQEIHPEFKIPKSKGGGRKRKGDNSEAEDSETDGDSDVSAHRRHVRLDAIKV